MAFEGDESVSLFEVVDRVLNKGVVIAGEVTLCVADIELIRLGLQVTLASTGKILELSAQHVEVNHGIPGSRGERKK